MSSSTQSAARTRISALLDQGSFVEIGAGVTARNTDFNLAEKKAPSDGVITGYGQIDGNPVYVYSQDASVLKGTMGEMHAKKIVRIYNLAVKTGAPVVGLIDCAGLRLEEATDALNAFGEVYMAQAKASGVVPQVTGIFGNCGGGMALVPAMADFTYMVSDKAKLYVNSPNAIKGNSEDVCDTASAEFQGEEAGTIDGMGTEQEVLSDIRTLVRMLPANNEDDMSYAASEDDLNRTISDASRCIEDPALLLPRISDDSAYIEVKPYYGKDMVTAFIRLNGYTVGAVANRSAKYDENGDKEEYGKVISAKGARKAAEFVNFCDAFSIPVVTFTNVTGFKACKCSEKHIADALAKLAFAFANATTPKVNVITGEAFGSASLTMNSRSLGADLVYAWTGAKIGMMDAKAAAKIMCDNADDIEKTAKEYDELQNSVDSAAARGYVDAVIDPADTRKYLIGALDMLFTKREILPDRKHGTV
ncbi:MAG: carboxyl transferase domain-containing protein [Eubacteriales bacterium]|jgi:acetyl-CoA carboxylase carboxyltransferase component